MADPREVAAMRRALELASAPDAPTGPNPRVGAVLLDADGVIVAEGHHRGAGTPHAEVDALERAGDRVRGATVVVTLEPCNHQGRTGPCTAALVDAGVVRVVFAQSDRSAVAAGGSERLRKAGVSVEGGVLEAAAAKLNPAFTFATTERRPYVTYKFAATMDGRIAAADGSSRWITGPMARADVHRLRSEVDAIVVGTGTVLSDNPQLTVRGVPGVTATPLRVVVGERELPADLGVFDDAAPTLRLLTRDPRTVLAELGDRDVQHVLIEGGPTLAAAFLRAGLVNQVVAYVAPALLGAGPSAVSDFGIQSLDEAPRLLVTGVESLGGDVRITASVDHQPAAAEGI